MVTKVDLALLSGQRKISFFHFSSSFTFNYNEVMKPLTPIVEICALLKVFFRSLFCF